MEKLYQDSKEREKQLKVKKETKEQKELEQLNSFTYTPEVNKPLDSSLFLNNTLIKDDKHVQKEIERFNLSRKQKLEQEIIKKKGGGSTLKNLDEIIKEEEELAKKTFKFGIETKVNKDTFDVLFTSNKTNSSFSADKNLTTTFSKIFILR